MATKLLTERDRNVSREVRSISGRELIATLTPTGIVFREKRKRTSYTIPYGVAFLKAADLAAASRMDERKRSRRVRRGSKLSRS